MGIKEKQDCYSQNKGCNLNREEVEKQEGLFGRLIKKFQNPNNQYLKSHTQPTNYDNVPLAYLTKYSPTAKGTKQTVIKLNKRCYYHLGNPEKIKVFISPKNKSLSIEPYDTNDAGLAKGLSLRSHCNQAYIPHKQFMSAGVTKALAEIEMKPAFGLKQWVEVLLSETPDKAVIIKLEKGEF